MKIELNEEADRELNEAIEYYNRERADLGWEFFSDLYDLLTLVARNPRRCPWVDDNSLRRCSMRRFPYSIVYSPDPDAVRVLAIYHQSRDPNYWRTRIK